MMKYLLIAVTILSTAFSQSKKYEGPEDSAGDIAAEREGYMTCLLYTSDAADD